MLGACNNCREEIDNCATLGRGIALLVLQWTRLVAGESNVHA